MAPWRRWAHSWRRMGLICSQPFQRSTQILLRSSPHLPVDPRPVCAAVLGSGAELGFCGGPLIGRVQRRGWMDVWAGGPHRGPVSRRR